MIRSVILNLATLALLLSTSWTDSTSQSSTAGSDYDDASKTIKQLAAALKAGQADDEVIRSVLQVGIDLPEGLESELSSLYELVPLGALPILIDALSNPSAGIRADAAHILRTMGPPVKTALPQLIRLLNDGEKEVRIAASEAVAEIDAKTGSMLPALLKSLHSESPEERLAAAWSLDKFGTAAGPILPDVIASFEDPDESVRYWLVNVLGNFPASTPHTLDTLIRLLGSDPSAFVRERVARELWEMGTDKEPEVARAVPILTAALSDPAKTVGLQAVKALRAIGERSKSALPSLEGCATREQGELAEECRKAIDAIKH